MPDPREALADAISAYWQEKQQGGLVVKWFLVMEGVDPEGDRWMDCVWSEGIKTWDVRGLLHEALDAQAAGMVAEELHREEN